MGNACMKAENHHTTANSATRHSRTPNTNGNTYRELERPAGRGGKLPPIEPYSEQRTMQTRSKLQQKTKMMEARADDTCDSMPYPIRKQLPVNAIERHSSLEQDGDVSKTSHKRGAGRPADDNGAGRGVGQAAVLQRYENDDGHRCQSAPAQIQPVPPQVAGIQQGRPDKGSRDVWMATEEVPADTAQSEVPLKKRKKKKRKDKSHRDEGVGDATASAALGSDDLNNYDRAQITRRISLLESDVMVKDGQIKSLTEQLHAERQKSEDLLIRLSAVAASSLSDNNPNIADLSDSNRPTKLAECYTEAYDNLWTDAFTELTETAANTEVEAIRTLLRILVAVYRGCREQADDQLDKLKFDVQAFTSTPDGKPDKAVMKMCKDIRKKNYKTMLPQIRKHVQNLVSHDMRGEMPQMTRFRDILTELCWLMAIQDPPVTVDVDTYKYGAPFDRNLMKAYTRSGKKVDYVVWPALYLHDGGPLLCKGVVQCEERVDPIRDGTGNHANNTETPCSRTADKYPADQFKRSQTHF